MSREVKDDLDKLVGFVTNYRIADIESESEFRSCISEVHKKYLAVLTLAFEVRKNQWDPSNIFAKDTGKIEKFHAYSEEAVSEIGTSFFLLLHGCYKAINLLLRSSIENFFKAVGSLEDTSILTLRSTYEVIDRAQLLKVFSDEYAKPEFSSLKNEYSDLCKTVHTADFEQMEVVESLGNFPHFDPQKCKATAEKINSVIRAELFVLNLIFHAPVKTIHHRNRDIVQTAFTARQVGRLVSIRSAAESIEEQ